MNRLKFISLFCFLLIICASSAKKVRTTVKITPEHSKKENITGTFIVNGENSGESNGYSLNQIVVTGYDKPTSSETESFFVTNKTDCTLASVNLTIEYLTCDSIPMHKRPLFLHCDIPAGETRKIDVKSWDRQKSFHYEKSRESRRGSTPYIVIITPDSCYLRFRD